MPGYLSVNDDRTLTPAGKAVVAKDFVPRGELAGIQVPARAGTRTGLWLPPVYRSDAAALIRIRGQIAAALYAGVDFEIACIGDSKTKGTLTQVGKQPDRSWPGVIRRALGGVEGFITAAPASEDDRWALTNMERGTDTNLDGVATIDAGAASGLSFAYAEAHTGGAFWVYSAAGGTVTVTVDGGAAQPFTVPAGGGFTAITPTVTGTAAHTYVLSTTASVRVRGFRPAFATPRLKITNLGRPTAAASHWAAGNPIGLWESFRTIVPTPGAIFCQLGTNAASSGGIPTVFTQIAAVTDNAVVVAPGGIGTTPDTQYGGMYLAVWNQADMYGIPLIDFATVIGNHDQADARGLMADIVHENAVGHAWEAAAVLATIGL